MAFQASTSKFVNKWTRTASSKCLTIPTWLTDILILTHILIMTYILILTNRHQDLAIFNKEPVANAWPFWSWLTYILILSHRHSSPDSQASGPGQQQIVPCFGKTASQMLVRSNPASQTFQSWLTGIVRTIQEMLSRPCLEQEKFVQKHTSIKSNYNFLRIILWHLHRLTSPL